LDVIGEWLPIAEPGVSDINDGTKKWKHGLHWRMVDNQLHLKKVLSKSLRGRRSALVAGAGNEEEYDLRSYPLLLEELAGKTTGSGPLVVREYTGLPWRTKPFQAKWRELARLLPGAKLTFAALWSLARNNANPPGANRRVRGSDVGERLNPPLAFPWQDRC
jgi:hypothetical protein